MKPTKNEGNLKRSTVLIASLFAIVMLLSAVPLVREFQLRLSDSYFRIAPIPKERSKVVLVLIDDASLKTYGRWPWSRTLLSNLTRRVGESGASAVGLDILLSEPQSPEADEQMRQALQDSSHLVLADKIGSFADGPRWVEPLPGFAQAARAVGHAQAVLDGDGICRRFPPQELTVSGMRFAFALELARLIAPERSADFLAAHGIQVADNHKPWIAAKPLLVQIPYRRDRFDAISAGDVLNGSDLNLLRGRPVIVGFGPSELGDRLNTPLSSSLPTPGVEVHAQILDSILNRRELNSTAMPWNIVIILLVCLCAVLLFRHVRGWNSIALLFGLALGLYLLGFVVFLLQSNLIPVAPMLLAVVAAPLLVSSADFVLVERALDQQLLDLRWWLASHSPRSLASESDLPWRLRLLQQLQTELGARYELHKVILEAAHDAVAIFDVKGKLLLENKSFSKTFSHVSELTLEAFTASLQISSEAPLRPNENGLEGEAYHREALFSVHMMPLPATSISPGGGTIVTLTSLRTREERDRARAEALGFITHELRTPLVSIQGFADLMVQHPQSPSCAGAPQTIFRESRRLLALINGYLDVLRLDAGARPLQSEEINLEQSVRQVFEIMQPLAAAANMTLVSECADIPAVSADTNLISGALLNLVSNAIKYGKPGTAIRVNCYTESDAAVISVQNVGDSIGTKDLPLLFESYYRASKPHTTTTGWGLGLAFVKRIAEKHGGRVVVEPQPDGTIFKIQLPKLRSVEPVKVP